MKKILFWLVASVVIILGCMFRASMAGETDIIPDWDIYQWGVAIGVIIAAVVVMVCGVGGLVTLMFIVAYPEIKKEKFNRDDYPV